MNAIKHRKLMTLLTKAKVDNDTRHSLIHSWTNGRTESTTQLTEQELDDLIWKIQNDFSFADNMQQTTSAMAELAIKQKRSTVLAIAQRVGIHEGTSFAKFNAWMKARSILKKKLNEYSFDELDQLISQMHKLEDNFNRSTQKAGTKAWHQHFGIPESSEN